MVPEKIQPTLEEIMIGVLMFPGPVVTKRSFKQSAGRKIRGIVDSEFLTALERLEKDGCGVIKKLRASVNARRETVVFVKLEELPGEIALVSRDEYRKSFSCQSTRLFQKQQKYSYRKNNCFRAARL